MQPRWDPLLHHRQLAALGGLLLSPGTAGVGVVADVDLELVRPARRKPAVRPRAIEVVGPAFEPLEVAVGRGVQRVGAPLGELGTGELPRKNT